MGEPRGPVAGAHLILDARCEFQSRNDDRRGPVACDWSAIYLGTLSTDIAYAAWSRLLTRYPTALVAPFALLVPCIGAIASALVFDEKFSFTRYVGWR
jgi:hypothetical protein